MYYEFTPVCVHCQTDLRVEKTGVLVIEMAKSGPYKVWQADLYKCPGCDVEIVTGFAKKPFLESHDPEFASKLAEEKAVADKVIYVYERPRAWRVGTGIQN